MQLVKMKDTASIFTSMMCCKIYDPTSNHCSIGTLFFATLLNRDKNGWLEIIINIISMNDYD